MPRIFVAPTTERSLDAALSLAPALLEVAVGREAAVLMTSRVDVVRTILGARQRRRSADLPRRATTGTSVSACGPAIHHALALPAIDALAQDARADTLLNRNLRGFLKGYTRAGARARYFGREVIAFHRRPGALLGYDVRSDGAVLIELVTGLEAPAVRPLDAHSRPPVALSEVLSRRLDWRELVARVHAGVAAQWEADLEELPDLPDAPARVEPDGPPSDARWGAVDVPIGRVEVAVIRAPAPRVWIRGDFLCSTARLDALEDHLATALGAGELDAGLDLEAGIADDRVVRLLAPLAGTPFHGARPEDVLRALAAALA